jgi:hypothetical protein
MSDNEFRDSTACSQSDGPTEIDSRRSQSAVNVGWGWPANSRKAHYFAGSNISICRKMMFFGSKEIGNDGSPDNCAECKKRLGRLQTTQGHAGR